TKGEVDKKQAKVFKTPPFGKQILIALSLLQTLEELNLLMDAGGSYASYRAALQSAKSNKAPCIPYLGVYKRDLIYYSEVDKSSECAKIDFNRKTLFFNLVQEIQQFQV